MLPITRAAEYLETSVENLRTSNKYRPFYIFNEGEQSMFDIDAYTKVTAKKERQIARVGLLIEYLNKELSMSYAYMGELAGLTRQQLGTLAISHKSALALLTKIKSLHPKDFDAFKEFYGMDIPS